MTFDDGSVFDYDATDGGYSCFELTEPKTEPKPEPEWIPCSERLPEPNQFDAEGVAVYYLVQDEWGDMMVAAFYERGRGGNFTGVRWWEQMHSLHPMEDKIVAWMELPKRYEEKEE